MVYVHACAVGTPQFFCFLPASDIYFSSAEFLCHSVTVAVSFTSFSATVEPLFDRLCSLVVRVSGCRSRGPGTARFSEKQWVWNRVHSAS
jgi:hypothetical protein